MTSEPQTNHNSLAAPGRTAQVELPYSEQNQAHAFRDGGWSPRLISVVALLVFTAELGFLAFAYPLIALPQIGEAFQTTQLAWLQTAYSLTAAVTAAIIGKLADRFGHRTVLLAVMTTVVIGLLVSAAAPNFGILIGGRVLQGTALSIPFLTPAIIRDVFPTRTVPFAVSIAASGSGILSVIATVLVVPVITNFGFRATFWVPAIVAAVLIVVVRLFVPESKERTGHGQIDFLGAALLGAGLAGVLLGVSLGPTWGWGSLLTVASIGLGTLLLAVWVVQALRVKDPLINLREVATFPLLVALLIAGIGIGLSTWFYVLMPIVSLAPGGDLGWGLGLTPDGEGMIATLFSLGTFVSGFVIGRALSKVPVPVVGAVAMILLAVTFGVSLLGLQNPILFGVAAFLAGGLTAASYAAAYNMVILVVEPERQATVSAVVSLAGFLMSAILPVAFFTVMASTASVGPEGAMVYSVSSMNSATLIPVVVALVAAGFTLALAVKRRGALQAGTRS
ncbi:MFS transporter [Arthrobacter sp. NPDC058097]|uniref:MFS transporter n=1 Tax=Arthrobacter sp. NPDC058097 TaxID=3346340 RepID=UPI0036DC89FB